MTDTVTHKITSKADSRNVLLGTRIPSRWDTSDDPTFDFQISGATGSNGFWLKDWDIEELPQPVVLPTNAYAVVQFEDVEWGGTRTFWFDGDVTWVEDDLDDYGPDSLKALIEEHGHSKFTVLYPGVEPIAVPF